MTLSKLNADKPELTPAPDSSQTIEWDDFMRVDLRVGTIVSVEEFPEARRPAYKLQGQNKFQNVANEPKEISKFY